MTKGNVHSVTATLTQAMKHAGVSNPQTGEPFSEAMLLGIGGGLGAGYILWEFKKHESANIVMGFRNRWNYTVEYLTNACNRLNTEVDERETGSKKKAVTNLEEALENGKYALVWTDKASIPYYGLPEEHRGHLVHIVGIHKKEGDNYCIEDLQGTQWQLTADELAEARAPIPSNKQRVLTIDPAYEFDLKQAILAGIQDHIDHLGRDSESFALPVYQKWAKLMTHPKNKKSWRVVFKERAGLYVTMRSIFEGIALDDTDGAGLRNLYTDFLTKANDIVDSDLSEAITAYRNCADLWVEFANTVLSDDVPEFAKTKQLMQERYANFAKQDVKARSQVMQELDQMEVQYNKAGFPLDDAETTALFEAMQDKLQTIYETEKSALDTLSSAINS